MMNQKIRYVWFALLVPFLALIGCSSSNPTQIDLKIEQSVFQELGHFRKEYVLVPGDKIEVAVWRVPEVSRTLVVRLDGKISLPSLQDVQAAGLSIPELTERLTQRLSKRLVDPNVTVIAIETREPMVYALGEVKQQMAIPLRFASTAIAAIARAGGAKRSSQLSETSIIRLHDDGVLRAIQIAKIGDNQPDPYMILSVTHLQSGDIIFIPESGRNEVKRFITDFINSPLTPLNLAIGSYANYKLIKRLN